MSISKLKLISLAGFSFLLFSCVTTFNHTNPYSGMEIIHYENSQGYLFKNPSSTRLVINIEGSGWDSVLGTQEGRTWSSTHNGAQMLQVFRDEYTFLIPEKLKRQPGLVYYENMEDRSNYTADNILNCYMEVINGYLSEHSFSSIILIGTSEGADLLPLIYERMHNKDNVKAIVSIGFGGLSLYECYSVLSTRTDLGPEYMGMFYFLLVTFSPGKPSYPDSYIEDVYGTSYRWLNSFKDIRPFDHYKNINIPILFIHGDYDYSIPVESTVFIQENLPEKPFEYMYYPWTHYASERADIIGLRNDIAKWVKKINP